MIFGDLNRDITVDSHGSPVSGTAVRFLLKSLMFRYRQLCGVTASPLHSVRENYPFGMDLGIPSLPTEYCEVYLGAVRRVGNTHSHSTGPFLRRLFRLINLEDYLFPL